MPAQRLHLALLNSPGAFQTGSACSEVADEILKPVAQQKSILITVEGEKNFELWLESNRMFLSGFEKLQRIDL